MRPDWYEIVKALTDRDMSVTIITNGFLFTEALIDQLKSARIESIAISLDGMESIHDTYRMKGSFKRAVQAMDILASHEIPVSVITTLHRQNVTTLEDMYRFLKDQPIFAWQLQACSPMGNASEDFSTEIDFSTVIRFVERHVYEAPFAMGIADNIGYYTKSEGNLRGSRSGRGYFRGCRAGLTSIGIDSVGHVRGCESMYDERFNEGSLQEKSLADIWYDPDAFAYNRHFTVDQLTGSCRTCRYGSICAGGCRSYNYFTHHKLYESLRCAIQSSEDSNNDS